MTVLCVTHRTEYRYQQPVLPGEHRLMCRPRDSHDLRLLSTGIKITPQPAELRWMHDVFGNSIAIATFADPTAMLVFESSFRAQHYPLPKQILMVDPRAATVPFSYAGAEQIDLASLRARQYADPQHRLDGWVMSVLGRVPGLHTLDVLMAIVNDIHAGFSYQRREEAGVQSPVETLNFGSGSCRDFAVFMMEAVRCIGMAAQFVSGYLYDEQILGGSHGLVGGGATHAWVQVYLPGVGWVEFDPTNALVGGRNLIRIAVAREAAQAAPLIGSFTGAQSDFLGMSVDIEVKAE